MCGDMSRVCAFFITELNCLKKGLFTKIYDQKAYILIFNENSLYAKRN